VIALALICVGACTSREGTYLVVTGTHDLTFDRVEFFFGKTLPTPTAIPATPGTPQVEPVGTSLVASRQLAQTDVQIASRPVQRLNYFLDDVAENHGLGDVVVAVGFRGTTPVGIGELRGFQVRFDRTYEYRIALTPYDPTSMEVWGRPDPDCVRWRDPAKGQVVVVRADDVDCDAFVDKVNDCAPLRYCDGSGRGGCVGEVACLVTTPTCALGGCVNTDDFGMDPCRATTCVQPTVCGSCIGTDPIADELFCSLDLVSSHGADFAMRIHGDQTLCDTPQTILVKPPIGLGCTNPKLEAVITATLGVPPTFAFAIASMGAACVLTITPPSVGAPWPGIHHLMVSVDPTGIGLRRSFIFGLGSVVGGCGSQTADFSNDPAGTCK
jgi:hypothetical protein